MSYQILVGDAREQLKGLADNSIDAVVTDPPYELGFMGRKWDSTGIANSVELWHEVLRVLKPGGHLLSFGGTRTYHRMTCAVEDAGFEIRDSLHWFYGVGFPKSLNISKALEAKWPATADAKKWQAWGTALKPGHEPIVLARKLLDGTVAANVINYGTGGLNIDACRLERRPGDRTEYGVDGDEGCGSANVYSFRPEDRGAYTPHEAGRWPPNVLLDEEAATELGDASRFFYVTKASRKERDLGCEGLPAKTGGEATYRQDGSAGLNNPRAGAGRTGGAKNPHPTVKPIALMEWLTKLITPPGGTVLDMFMGSGTTGMACQNLGFNFIGIEQDPEYVKIAEARIKYASEKACAS